MYPVEGLDYSIIDKVLGVSLNVPFLRDVFKNKIIV